VSRHADDSGRSPVRLEKRARFHVQAISHQSMLATLDFSKQILTVSR
jgi:hypothetical protein